MDRDQIAKSLADMQINDPKKYKELMSKLIESEKNGNEDAKYIIGKVGEISARDRKGYEGLQEFATVTTGGVPGLVGIYLPRALGSAWNGYSMFDHTSPGVVKKEWQEQYPVLSTITNVAAGITAGGGLEAMTRNTGGGLNFGDFYNYNHQNPKEVLKEASKEILSNIKNSKVDLDAIVNNSLNSKSTNKNLQLDKIPISTRRFNTNHLNANNNNSTTEIFLSDDYPKGESLLAKRLESGATERVDWLKEYDGNKLAEYIRQYVPYEATSLTENHSQSRWGKDIILSNRNLPRKYYNSKSVGNYGRDLNGLDELPLSKEELADVFDHEILHDIHAKILDWRKIDPDINNIFSREFLTKQNGINFRRNGNMVTDEITPRIVQVKNFLGITDGKKLLTGEELKKGMRAYIENRFDNDMQYLYDNVKDWDRFANWVNKTVPVIAGGIMVNEYEKSNN